MKDEEGGEQKYHERLHSLMDTYVHLVYRVSRDFPKEEQYGATSQLRRAALSVILNYVEGYARQRSAVHKNFLEISFGSLKESAYLTEFSLQEGWLKEPAYRELKKLEREIGAMIWGALRNM
ncbi:MAG: four helix bundle protein [bacterium]|nr:four helix bundle protein [bacterium]